MKKEILIPSITLFLICLVATLLLSMTNSVTKEKIAAVEKQQAEKARQLVLPEAELFEQVEAGDDVEIMEGKNSAGETVGYTVTTMDKSYGGDIKVMTGLDPDGKVTGVEILTIDDTPGLGMNAKKKGFRDQYKGKEAGDLVVSKTASGDEIQAITGATKTSNAVTRCVNAAYDAVFNKKGEN